RQPRGCLDVIYPFGLLEQGPSISGIPAHRRHFCRRWQTDVLTLTRDVPSHNSLQPGVVPAVVGSTMPASHHADSGQSGKTGVSPMASKFHKHSVADIARATPVSHVTDREIWNHLVTPMVRALLGPIDFASSRIKLLETTKGLFPGDDVSNLNDHRLYGGQAGFIRFPYLHSFYKTENGAFIVKRDGAKFEAIVWFGDVLKGR